MRLSRSKIELYFDCPRCFYMDVVMKVSRPSTFPLNLNNAVDLLMKKEFDGYRQQGTPHPIQTGSAAGFIGSAHPMLDCWRSLKSGGLTYFNPKHDCTYYGIIDDLWVNKKNQYVIVDYKSTAKEKPVEELPTWGEGYKRQLSFYNYLLKKNDFETLNFGFFVYATAIITKNQFHNKLEFITNLIKVELDDTWVENILDEIQNLLQTNNIPDKNKSCKHCLYTESINRIIKKN